MVEYRKLKTLAKYPTGKLNSNAAVEGGAYPFFTCAHEIYSIDTYSYDGEYVLLGGNNASGDFPIFYYNGKFDAYQRTYLIQPIDDTINTRYLYYAIGLKLRQMKSNAAGTATRFLTQPILDNLKIEYCDIMKQKEIVDIISAYDDLIENNNKRIKILEQMAENLYKEWFVRFRFPGYEEAEFEGGIPKGWHIKKLQEIAEIIYGYSFDSSRFSTEEINIPVVRIRDILSGETKTYTDEKPDDKYIINEKDILIGMDGLFHMNIWHTNGDYQNQRVVRIKSKTRYIGNYFIYYAIYPQIKMLELIIQGTTVAHLSAKDMNKLQVVVPNENILQMTHHTLEPLLEEIIKLKKQNENLTKQRDLLLPRLMSGKLEIK